MTSATTKPQTTSSSSSANISLSAQSPTQDIVYGIWQRYFSETPQRILLLDAFMGFLIIVGAMQFVYCVLAGNYPFNAFLSGFSAAVGQFVLTASLRMQTSDQGGKDGKSVVKGNNNSARKGNGDIAPGVSSERAFADYVFGSIILHFFCINFIN
ncbi:hypothetical protein AJ80_07561 [Polytolypa hystricis UAMH7299]|uniref:Dolichyl-diphosphooligosaccharide--protein glycosyltransferase subunit OST2 n=1 Tax=Polytolypa hystricis (strain UAMH7299) TaxID=1447883 RepID=A0A2B7XNH2_POLH7|nr:hypothetical protein AJ80_07561 [Polytolypa hystricis UAMH7299]